MVSNGVLPQHILAEPVPPETYRFVADIDAAIEKNIFDLPQRKRIADIHHDRETNYLRRAVEITEGILHRCKLRNSPACLKPICSDTALFPRTNSVSKSFGTQRTQGSTIGYVHCLYAQINWLQFLSKFVEALMCCAAANVSMAPHQSLLQQGTIGNWPC